MELDAKIWYGASLCHLESSPKGASKRYFIFFKLLFLDMLHTVWYLTEKDRSPLHAIVTPYFLYSSFQMSLAFPFSSAWTYDMKLILLRRKLFKLADNSYIILGFWRAIREWIEQVQTRKKYKSGQALSNPVKRPSNSRKFKKLSHFLANFLIYKQCLVSI